MSTVPSPAELYWRIGWLAGTATPPPPQPEPGPASEPVRQAFRSAVRRSILEQSIRVQVDAERQIAAVFGVPPATVRVHGPGSATEQVDRMLLHDRLAARRRIGARPRGR